MSHPGPNGGNLPSHTNSGASNSRQQDTGLHGTSQDPGPSCNPQHHVSARPLLYIHAPPPPPPSFLHYQWPMPFSYNPFAGFPGMGYGMVMPTFSPYMEAPTYILPQPHIQPVDYRLLLQPQVHVPSTSIQNPNQTHRIRLPHTVPVRQTVNIEVQTEPPQPTQTSVGHYGQRSPVVGSDSGHGTTSSSPSSSTSFEKKGSEAENYTLPHSDVKDIQVNRTCTSDAVFNIIEPTEMETAQSSIRATLETQRSCNDTVGKENVSPCKEDHCNMGSVSSPDSEGPVCSSSQQEDEVAKERSVSSSNILISWGSGTPQATLMNLPDKVLPQNDQQLLSSETELEHEKLVGQSPNETNNDQLVADNININDAAENILSSKNSENFFKILKLPFTLHEIFFDSRSDCEK
uniref:bucky ball n=1 Tax=Monopterus albus TaxID=43700 RepID=UPI0009B4E6BE|nr:uncharacterized protein LOC109951154 [Monopterus albus]